MSRLPADARARERVLDPSRSFIVKAPAGSGKTSLLAARYLALLAGASRPEEVLAVTFTRKATGEMRARVLEALAAAPGPAPQEPWARRVHGLARAAAARDAERGWALRDNPQRLAVHTIDALCTSLARRLPVLSGLGGTLSPVEDPLPLYRGAARRTLELLDDAELGPPVLRTLDHLDGNVAAFETLLAQMLARRDQWMRYLRMDDPHERRRELETGLREVVEAELAAVRGALPEHLLEALAGVARAAGRRALALGVEPELAVLADRDGLPPARGEALAQWKALAALLLTARGELRKRPPGKVFSAREERAPYDAMHAVLAGLAGDDGLAAALAALRDLPAPRYDDAQWATLLDLFAVLRLAVAGLRVEFARAGASDFAEQVSAASQALGDELAPTDLALALDYRIRHLLVDEFQDTSAAHFDVVRRLTAGWSPGDGHSLFLVGDPMQSIYRFREAEVGLFLGCWGGGALEGLGLEPVALSANFRSAAGVVDWVNDTFPAVLAPRDDPARAAVAYEPSRAVHDAEPGVAVQVHAARAGDAAAAARVAEVVAAVRAQRAQDRIAILLRARNQAPAVVAALRARGLGFRGVDLEPLLRVPAVLDLHALCAALLHPLDRVSWLAVLRAPWCGLTLDDLEALAGADPRAAPGALLAREDVLRRLSPGGRARLARVAPVLLAAAARLGRDPLARLLARTWRALGGPACLGPAQLEDARHYLALVAAIERESGMPDPDELARRAQALYAAPAAGEVDVEIMTIHKAKGLEFDVVLLPQLERRPPREARALLAWSETAAPGGARLLLAPLPPPEGEQHSPLNAFVRRVEQDKRARETARLLYVACTRAKRSLHLFASVAWDEQTDAPRPPRDDSLLAHLWPVVGHAFRDAPVPRQAGVAAAARAPAIRRLPAGWEVPAPPPGLGPVAHAGAESAQAVEFSWAGERVRQSGVVAHALLRRIADDGVERWDPARLAAAQPWIRDELEGLGLTGEALDDACAAVIDAVARTLADARGRWLLDARHDGARSEYAVAGLVGGTLVRAVLDRTFVDADGVRWIVDYKTGRHEGGGADEFLDREQERYRGQLERHARLLQAMDPRPVRLALYFPAMAGWREWAFEGSA